MSQRANSLFSISLFRIARNLIAAPSAFEVLFLLEGTISLSCDDHHLTIRESDIALLPASCEYQLSPDRSATILSVKITPELPATEFLRNITLHIFASSSDEFGQLRETLAEIASSYFSKESPAELPLFSLIYKMLYLISSAITVESSGSGTGDKAVSDRINTIQAYILQNFRQPLTLNDIARDNFFSPQYLSRLFKQMIGVNFYDYLNEVRLNSALFDLLNTQDTITKICFNNGFPNLSAFNKVFKDKHTVSPQQYRKDSVRKKTGTQQVASNVDNVDFKSVEHQISSYLHPASQEKHLADALRTTVIEADTTKHSPFKLIWNQVFNLGFASDLNKSQLRSQIEMFQGKTLFKYARFQGIFNEDPAISSNVDTNLNFYNCDRLIDYLYSINLLPFIEIGNKPKKIDRRPNKNLFNEDKNYSSLTHRQLETIFKGFLKHCINRYGVSEVEKWKFEFWAEHDESLRYNSSYIADYIPTFRNIYTTVKSMVPRAQVGGPGFNMAADLNVLSKIVSGLKNLGITPDFVSFYTYPYTIIRSLRKQNNHDELDSEEYSLIWDKNQYAKNTAKLKKIVRQINPDIRNFYITEWNIDISNRNFLHDSCFKAPFILQTIINSYDLVDGIGYWLLSDISSEYIDTSRILYGGAGLFNRNGIRKPGYFAYDFLSELGTNLIKKGENHIITRRNENEYEVLVFNYKYLSHYSLVNYDSEKDMFQINNLLEDFNDLDITVRLKNVGYGKFSVKQYALNSEHGSLLDEWIRLNATGNIRQSEVDYLQNICIPKRQIYNLQSTSTQELILNCHLLPNEVDLFLIRREID